jgi:hypothetical protein
MRRTAVERDVDAGRCRSDAGVFDVMHPVHDARIENDGTAGRRPHRG